MKKLLSKLICCTMAIGMSLTVLAGCGGKEDPAKAYTHKHTDITLPYESLGQISVLLDGGDAIDIIRGGRFVLRGTDLLNDALREQALEEKKEEQDERSTV